MSELTAQGPHEKARVKDGNHLTPFSFLHDTFSGAKSAPLLSVLTFSGLIRKTHWLANSSSFNIPWQNLHLCYVGFNLQKVAFLSRCAHSSPSSLGSLDSR